MKWIALVLPGLLVVALANAASFNCSKASSKVEHIVCDNRNISKLDEELAQRFKGALQDHERAALVIQSQRQWLKNRNLCADVQCVTQAYTNRLADLSAVNSIRGISSSIPLPPEHTKACRKVAEHMNRNSLKELFINSSDKAPSDNEIQRIFGDSAHLGLYWALDLNNDAIRDHLLIYSTGSMGSISVFARSGKDGTSPYSMGDVENAEDSNVVSTDSIDSADVISTDGQNFIFAENKLWNLSKDGRLQAVCAFEYTGSPITEITTGKENSICKKVLASKKEIQHVHYDEIYALSESNPDYVFLNDIPLNNVVGTHVDIDNDGKQDNVVRLEYMSMRGRGCSAVILASTDKSETHIPGTKLNDLLLNDLLISSGAGAPCGSNFDVLTHGGETYVDMIHDVISYGDPLDKGGHTLYRIKQDKAEIVCESKTRILVNAVSIK